MNQMASDYLLAAAIAYAVVFFRGPVPGSSGVMSRDRA